MKMKHDIYPEINLGTFQVDLVSFNIVKKEI